MDVDVGILDEVQAGAGVFVLVIVGSGGLTAFSRPVGVTRTKNTDVIDAELMIVGEDATVAVWLGFASGGGTNVENSPTVATMAVFRP